jgi:hypothetical protein
MVDKRLVMYKLYDFYKTKHFDFIGSIQYYPSYCGLNQYSSYPYGGNSYGYGTGSMAYGVMGYGAGHYVGGYYCCYY